MTTECEIHIYDKSETHAREVAKNILTMAKGLEKKYNFYDKESYLFALNMRNTKTLDSQTKELLLRAKKFYEKTQGVFDVTMGTLSVLQSAISLEERENKRETLTPFVGSEHFSIKHNKLFFDNPHTTIDLGGFVKEFAVDLAIKILKKAKITSALVNFGGDIYALGEKPNKSPFLVGVKNPLNTSTYISHVTLFNEALTTSASYERSIKIEDKSYSHIFSKESHLQQEIISATVMASSVVESGVFSTALMVKPQLTCHLKKILITNELKII
jgi:thiamine biosynthesis lipoprotein